MKKGFLLFILFILVLACKEPGKATTQSNPYLASQLPFSEPLNFTPLIIPENMLVHRGVFSPDLHHFYYTLSPPDFSQFDIYVMEKEGKNWSKGRKAFFNSDYADHGMSFSPDGNSIYFSSTRPVQEEGVLNSWHIWKSERLGESWGEAQYLDIPNMREKLLSHPCISNSGRLYFHASNLDYSEMHLYYADRIDGQYQAAVKMEIPGIGELNTCTPYISPEEDFLIFATISHELELMIAHKTDEGSWRKARKFSEKINTKGQGNPFLSPDQTYLFYAAEGDTASNWSLKWVDIESELKKQ